MDGTVVNEFETILLQASHEMDIALSDREIALFVTYCRTILFWNAKMSLVSVKSPLDLPVKHCVDSLTAAPLIGPECATLLDIGTGAGFPGIPLKIMRNALRVTLVDSNRKKVSFLKQVARELDLAGITAVNERIETLTDHARHRGMYDVVISRAALGLAHYITLGAPFLSPGGTLIAMKGPGVDAELEDTAAPAREAGIVLARRHEVSLPIIGDRRIILLFKRSL